MAAPVESVMRRVQHAMGFGRTTTAPDDSGAVQMVQIKTNAFQTIDAVPVIFSFGLSSVAPLGAVPVHLSAEGDRAKAVVLAHHHPASRPTNTPEGGTVLYDVAGTTLLLSADGNATWTVAGTLTINCPSIIINGQVLASGNVTAGNGGGDSIELQGHVHTNGGGTGNSGPPAAGS
ncbi:MAG: phage baseplate assembly protein domain-containing protein [Janthinobacterium lividum]